MKKYLHIIIVFSLIAFYNTISYGQSIQVKSGPMFGEVDGSVSDEQLIGNLTLINNTDKSINFKMSVKLIKLVLGHEISICWNVCLPPFHDDYTSPLTYTLEPNQVTTEGLFSVHLYPYMLISDNPVTYTDPIGGTSIIKITFENADNPNDRSEYTLTFNVNDPNSAVEDSYYSDLNILGISPNPAIGGTKLSFSSKIENGIQHLDIYDILGNLMISQEINNIDGDVFVDTSKLTPGSYYCQLVSGEFKKSEVKTLIIK